MEVSRDSYIDSMVYFDTMITRLAACPDTPPIGKGTLRIVFAIHTRLINEWPLDSKSCNLVGELKFQANHEYRAMLPLKPDPHAWYIQERVW